MRFRRDRCGTLSGAAARGGVQRSVYRKRETVSSPRGDQLRDPQCHSHGDPVNTAAIRQARPDDLDPILRLLQAADLPTDGIADHIAMTLVAESEGTVIGAIALEPYGDTGLLRSAVVAPARRNDGLGSALYEKLLARAHSLGIKRMVLLTTTAERYFQRKGFHPIERATLTGPITQSMEFRGACPASAVCMER